MSVPVPREPRHGDRWETIRYALDSNARTLRLCLIWFVSIASPVVATVVTMLMRHMLLCARCISARSEEPTDRITVALIPKAGEDLQRLQDRTGLSKTDIVNRAISMYEFVDAELGTGADMIMRRDEGGLASGHRKYTT